jgi:hypothetical protein
MSTDFRRLPPDLPAPVDNGAADHLPGSTVPGVALPSMQGGEVDLAEAARERLVVYVYPRTGMPASVDSTGWVVAPCRPRPRTLPQPRRRFGEEWDPGNECGLR